MVSLVNSFWGAAPDFDPVLVDTINDSTRLNGCVYADALGDTLATVISNRLVIWDISDKANPSFDGELNTAGAGDALQFAWGVKLLDENTAIVTKNTDALYVLDITTRSSISVTGSISNTQLSGARGLALFDDGTDDYAAVAAYNVDRITTVDLSTLSSPSIADSIADSTNLNGIYDIHVDGNTAYCAAYLADRITQIGIGNPSSITSGTSFTNTKLNGVRDVTVSGSEIYAGGFLSGGEFAAYNSSGTLQDSISNTADIVVKYGTDYILSLDDTELRVYDITTPTSLSEVGDNLTDLGGGRYITIVSNYAYVVDSAYLYTFRLDF